MRHDAAHDDGKGHKHPPIADFVTAALLSGMRFNELATLRWEHIDLEAGEIRLPYTSTKTGHARTVGLRESPILASLLARRKLAGIGDGWVFGPMRRDVAEAARKRLVRVYGAPRFTWHDLRRTCGTFLTCAPAIYGAASAFLSAKRLGHGVAVAERHYAGQLNNVAREATTLEAAMGIADLLPVYMAAPAALAS